MRTLRGGGLALYGLGVISTIDNVVRPLLTRRGLQLHPLLVFISVFGGVISFGFVGLFLGPLVVALVVSVLEAYERHVGEAQPTQGQNAGGAGVRPSTFAARTDCGR